MSQRCSAVACQPGGRRTYHLATCCLPRLPCLTPPPVPWLLRPCSTGVSPLLRGVEIGLAHGFLLVGPFIKLGPLRNVENVAEIVGCINGAATVLILTLCLAAYGAVTFQGEGPQVRQRSPC